MLRWLPALGWAALIYVASSQSALPRAPDPLLDVLVKKAAHLTEYAILAVLLLHALSGGPPRAARARLALAWLLAVLYAVSDEVHQAQVPGRTAAPLDVAIDAVGAALGLALRQALRAADRRPDPPAWDRV